MALLVAENLTKIYGMGEAAVVALDHVNFCVEAGEFVAVMGPSGCGKSTLLHLLGALDRPTQGCVRVDGQDLGTLDDDKVTVLRRRRMGFVFQFHNLIPVLSAVDNAALPLLLDGAKPADARARAAEWLDRMGLGDRLSSLPSHLSGGQSQRVAIARALATDPALVLADEPTGNLDTRAGDDVAGLLRRMVSEWGRTVLMVTHDPRVAAHADRLVFLKDGAIVDETRLGGEGEPSGEDTVRARVKALSPASRD